MVSGQFENPFTALISGPTMSGKTNTVCTLLREAVKSDLYSRRAGPIYYFYNLWSPSFYALVNEKIVTKWFQGPCNMDWIKKNVTPDSNTTIVIDDMGNWLDQSIVELFTVGAHQLGLNVIFISQSLFSKNAYLRTISTNATYIILQKNPRDTASIKYLARQMAPQKADFIVWAYNKATERPYSHFMIDFSQRTIEELRFRSNVFASNSNPIVVYVREEPD